MRDKEFEKIREYLACPEIGDDYYGAWWTLNREQRIAIFKLWEENKMLRDVVKRHEEIFIAKNYADDFADKLYPLTIVKDRYGGVYSGGRYTAWLLDAEEVPKEIFGEDTEARGYWYDHDPLCGKGDTVSSAIMDLAGKAEGDPR